MPRIHDLPSFPSAQQAQIIRSNQRDLFHVSALREQTEGVLRSWLGTRWLTRWEKEIELGTKLLYYGLTVGRATQTLGEEYTEIWAHSASRNRLPSRRVRLALVLIPTLPSYLLARWGSLLSSSSIPQSLINKLPTLIEVISEINLAIFYFRGTYYNIAKRVLGIRYISLIPEDPNSRPPSYSLLGILLGIRLIYRLLSFIRTISSRAEASDSALLKGKRHMDDTQETYIDDQAVSSMLRRAREEDTPPPSAEDDDRTVLDFSHIPATVRASRNCTLCLEERTASAATECGHLFCWDCIVGWGREKPECPLCRQTLNLTALLPVYNL